MSLDVGLKDAIVSSFVHQDRKESFNLDRVRNNAAIATLFWKF